MTMLYQQIASDGPSLIEHELTAMAKMAYEEMLSKLCTQQRADPQGAERFSICNRVLIDHYDRLTHLGAQLPLTSFEESQMSQAGWEQERIERLKVLLRVLEDGASTDLCDEYVDSLLRRRGHTPDDRSRWTTQLALYPSFRDAHIEAEVELQPYLGRAKPVEDVSAVTSCISASDDIVGDPVGLAMSDFIE